MRNKKHFLTLILAMFVGAIMTAGTFAAAQTESVLHSFKKRTLDGSYPRAPLVRDNAGNLYGTTVQGGSYDGGTAFELHNAGGTWTEKVLFSFQPRPKYGVDQISGLVFDKAGNLYGTTSLGGTDDNGTVFELSPKAGGGWTEMVLHSFSSDGTDGYSPLGGVIVDSAGNLYGTTYVGGTGTCQFGGCGTVFKLTPATGGGWTETIIYNFVNDGVDGANPYFGLTFDASGNLYGTTYFGGANKVGTVYRLTPVAGGGWTESVIHSFGSGSDGYAPGNLIFHNGNLIGPTSAGGGSNAEGTVFELTPTTGGGWTEQILYTFIIGGSFGDNPVNPGATVVLDTAGNMYGVSQKGTGLTGTVWELSPQAGGTWAFNVLFNFDNLGADGEGPIGVILDSHGNIYGTTGGGGAYGDGTVFEITP